MLIITMIIIHEHDDRLVPQWLSFYISLVNNYLLQLHSLLSLTICIRYDNAGLVLFTSDLKQIWFILLKDKGETGIERP